MQLLNLLLLTPSHCPSFSLHLSELDPLPVIHDGSFRKFHEQQQLLREANDQNSLEQEMNRFIKAGQSLSITTRSPGLRRLTDMIRSCRSDVSHLLRNGCDSVLRLVRGLVGVASPLVTTPTVAMEMGRCLGELGGLDLNCIALPTVPVKGESFSHSIKARVLKFYFLPVHFFDLGTLKYSLPLFPSLSRPCSHRVVRPQLPPQQLVSSCVLHSSPSLPPHFPPQRQRVSG